LKRYLITDPSFYSSSASIFKKRLARVYKRHTNINLACFRDKEFVSFLNIAKIFVKLSNQFNIKPLINSSIDIACRTQAYGVHLTSKQFDLIKEAKNKNLYTICSTHNIQEAYKAYELGADCITYSPIFTNKYSLRAKNIYGLKQLVKKKIPIKIFALGGIVSDTQVQKLTKSDIYGFASIKYFIKDN